MIDGDNAGIAACLVVVRINYDAAGGIMPQDVHGRIFLLLNHSEEKGMDVCSSARLHRRPLNFIIEKKTGLDLSISRRA